MKEPRKHYDDDFVKAITGRGEYSMMKYSHLELSTDQWFSMTLKQRESYSQPFYTAKKNPWPVGDHINGVPL